MRDEASRVDGDNKSLWTSKSSILYLACWPLESQPVTLSQPLFFSIFQPQLPGHTFVFLWSKLVLADSSCPCLIQASRFWRCSSSLWSCSSHSCLSLPSCASRKRRTARLEALYWSDCILIVFKRRAKSGRQQTILITR